jgi:hypothetical protein
MKTTKSITTEIIINSSAERVWSVLTDLSNYEKWNPFLIRSEGEIKPKAKLKNAMLNGNRTMTFKPVVQQVEHLVYFDWIGNLFIPGIFDGHHYFRIQAISENQVKLIHGENFSGVLSSFIFRKIGNDTRMNFIRMNQAIKIESEQ